MKPILDNLEVVKQPFFAIFGTLNFVNLVSFSLQEMQNFTKIKNWASRCVEMADFETLESPKLISREI